MFFRFQPLKAFSRENIRLLFKFQTPIHSVDISSCPIPANPKFHFFGKTEPFRFVHSDLRSQTQTQQDSDGEFVNTIQNVLRSKINSSKVEIKRALDQCGLALTEDLVLNVLRRYRSDWKPAYAFFNWVRRGGRHTLTSSVYNEIIDVLGKVRRFDEMTQVFDEMSERENLVDEETYRILVNRYAAAHKVEEAINVFHRRKDFGLELDLVAFEKLLMCLCRYKHVEVAETLFYSKRMEFCFDIKTWNIILNGWCVLGSVYEAKRFWKDIIASNCRPDLFTHGTFINALTKKGKLGTAMKLFRGMWEKGYKPDVVICNCVIDALCFKKRIPEALEIFRQMNETGPPPNVATYNSLIKHLCKIRRMEKVYEFLDEMEEKGGSCLPNDITFNFLLKSLRKPEEVPVVLVRMERNGCSMTTDTYNLILKLLMDWDYQERVRHTWDEMEKKGFGPDRRSYTIMIHGLFDKGRNEDALSFFSEMKSKEMIPEPRTELLVNAMNTELNKEKGEQDKGASLSDKSSRPLHKRKRKMRDS